MTPYLHGIMRSPALIAAAFAVLCTPAVARTQTPPSFGICVPVAQRAGRDVGCFTITEQSLGTLTPERAFWHVTRFASRTIAQRENAMASVKGTVIDAFGTPWLVTIADSAWRPRGGRHVAVIGPLPITPGVAYSALYMEATFRPGMKSSIHRHSGPEAWYTIQGETCLETPNGIQVGRAGGPPVIVPGGPPMELTATGTKKRESLVLILHDASQPPTSMESTWKPRGLCQR
jgi:quercetin dioxygenase-like cupin family protein